MLQQTVAALILLSVVIPASNAGLACRNVWDENSCKAFADVQYNCDLDKSPMPHIAKLCRKSCDLCRGEGSEEKPKPPPEGGKPNPGAGGSKPSETGGGKKPATVPPTQAPKTEPPKPFVTHQPETGDTSGDHCPAGRKYGSGPPKDCPKPVDPNNRPKSGIEEWFTKEMFDDLFPKANLGWGPSDCWPYSYEAFAIAARYFPRFGTESPNTIFTPEQNYKRDLAAFLSHAIQETGENNPGLYDTFAGDKEKADSCFYRGGFYNWFEGGAGSAFLDRATPGHYPNASRTCIAAGRYCANDKVNNFFYPCSNEESGSFHKDCYFGRGAIQISYNFNYGPFSEWLNEQGIEVDLLKEPWQVMEKMDPPISVMASMWFYMTPQPPKPAMHDIVMGVWEPGQENRDAGYSGPIFGPTSLIINNECEGEDEGTPGGPGESRRIKAFKWFSKHFGFPLGPEDTLSCHNMPVRLDKIAHKMSYAPDWSSTWKSEPCKCAPAAYAGPVPYYDKGFYPDVWVERNGVQKEKCEKVLKTHPDIFALDPTSPCLSA